MLTTRGTGLLGTAGVFWLLSRILGVQELAMGTVAILGLITLAVLVTRVTSASLQIERRLFPDRLFHEAESEVELHVRNRGSLPTALLALSDLVPPSLSASPRALLAPLRHGQHGVVHYKIIGRLRGIHEIGPLQVQSRDPFGIAKRTRLVGDTTPLIVYPPVWQLPAGLPLSGLRSGGGEGRPRPSVSGDELAMVREYVRGDDLRKVHWRSTAHRGRLMVRQDESRQDPHAVIVLDKRSSSHAGRGTEASFEQAVATVASATYHFAERSIDVRLIDGPFQHRPPALSWRSTLDLLAAAHTAPKLDLAPVWTQLGRGTAGEGILLAIVGPPTPGDLRAMVRGGRPFAIRLALLLDTRSFGQRSRHDRGVDESALALRAAGWRTAVLRSGDRVDHLWQELIVQRPGTAVGGA